VRDIGRERGAEEREREIWGGWVERERDIEKWGKER
jgi:hypothetical protein